MDRKYRSIFFLMPKRNCDLNVSKKLSSTRRTALYRDMVINPGLPDQQQRRPEQRYVMFFVESPQNYRCTVH